jgi:hypothetical protein
VPRKKDAKLKAAKVDVLIAAVICYNAQEKENVSGNVLVLEPAENLPLEDAESMESDKEMDPGY